MSDWLRFRLAHGTSARDPVMERAIIEWEIRGGEAPREQRAARLSRPKNEDLPVLFSVEQARVQLGNIGLRTPHRIMASGDIAVTKVGGRTFIAAPEIARYIRSNTSHR